MGPGPGESDLDRSLLVGANIRQIDKIPTRTPPQELLECILEHEKTGEPLVVTGLDLDPHWHSPSLGADATIDGETGIL
jgi:hypothetical protein